MKDHKYTLARQNRQQRVTGKNGHEPVLNQVEKKMKLAQTHSKKK